jgi:hypothetical protein
MAEIKTKPNSASVEDFINSITDEQKRKDSFVLLEMMKRAMRDNFTQTNDYRWRVLPIYIGTGYVAIKKQIIIT